MVTSKNKKYLDPAAGTGDLLISFTGDINLWEISEDAVEMAKLNYSINNKNMKIIHTDSLLSNITNHYEYVTINPPFGTKTIIKDESILNKFVLGQKRKKQEIGILFIELGLRLLKKGGILMAILPGGYLGNISNKYLREYIPCVGSSWGDTWLNFNPLFVSPSVVSCEAKSPLHDKYNNEPMLLISTISANWCISLQYFWKSTEGIVITESKEAGGRFRSSSFKSIRLSL